MVCELEPLKIEARGITPHPVASAVRRADSANLLLPSWNGIEASDAFDAAFRKKCSVVPVSSGSFSPIICLSDHEPYSRPATYHSPSPYHSVRCDRPKASPTSHNQAPNHCLRAAWAGEMRRQSEMANQTEDNCSFTSQRHCIKSLCRDSKRSCDFDSREFSSARITVFCQELALFTLHWRHLQITSKLPTMKSLLVCKSGIPSTPPPPLHTDK
ncbi:unnamed protein product [Protopolystoma xenopodis]|uniref:Uncharacterized protein n=1 Tax=Protopolystoma xenopodis TaxID=117903 RepID=A0A448XMX8_9PLAT|nr:unnamed protein product [Protopolystoma xenopodis]